VAFCIDSNLVIRQTDPKLAFPTYLQGIDAFDEDWTNLTVTNNVIVTSACWGIGYASLHGSKIINNTVVDDGTDAGTKNPAGNSNPGPRQHASQLAEPPAAPGSAAPDQGVAHAAEHHQG
jgi:hypothetical protein